jgi:hypothetical protein
MLGLAGVTVMAERTAGVTVNSDVPLTDPAVAEMAVWPEALP